MWNRFLAYARLALIQSDKPLRLVMAAGVVAIPITWLAMEATVPESWGSVVSGITGVATYLVLALLLAMYVIAPVAGLNMAKSVEQEHGADFREQLIQHFRAPRPDRVDLKREALSQSKRQDKPKKPKKLRQGRY